MASVTSTGKKKVQRFVEATNGHRRHATYTLKSVKCPNSSLLTKRVAKPGMMVKYKVHMNDLSFDHMWGRMLARVDAPFVPGSEPQYNCPEVKGWLAVVELSWCGHVGFIRWIDPVDVVEVYESPRSFPAWFFQEELPGIPEVLAMDRHGSMSESYVDKWIKEHGGRQKGSDR